MDPGHVLEEMETSPSLHSHAALPLKIQAAGYPAVFLVLSKYTGPCCSSRSSSACALAVSPCIVLILWPHGGSPTPPGLPRGKWSRPTPNTPTPSSSLLGSEAHVLTAACSWPQAALSFGPSTPPEGTGPPPGLPTPPCSCVSDRAPLLSVLERNHTSGNRQALGLHFCDRRAQSCHG